MTYGICSGCGYETEPSGYTEGGEQDEVDMCVNPNCYQSPYFDFSSIGVSDCVAHQLQRTPFLVRSAISTKAAEIQKLLEELEILQWRLDTAQADVRAMVGMANVYTADACASTLDSPSFAAGFAIMFGLENPDITS